MINLRIEHRYEVSGSPIRIALEIEETCGDNHLDSELVSTLLTVFEALRPARPLAILAEICEGLPGSASERKEEREFENAAVRLVRFWEALDKNLEENRADFKSRTGER